LQSLVDLEYPYIQFAYVVKYARDKRSPETSARLLDQAKYEHVGMEKIISTFSWFIEPLRDGKVHVTDLYSSRSTGASLYYCLRADPENEVGEIKGILGLDIRFEV